MLRRCASEPTLRHAAAPALETPPAPREVTPSFDPAANAVWRVAELCEKIVSHADGPTLFAALQVTKSTRALFADARFWRGKLAQHGIVPIVGVASGATAGVSIGVQSMRHLYQHTLRTIAAIEQGARPQRTQYPLQPHNRDISCGGPHQTALVIRSADALSTICSLDNAIVHTSQPLFYPQDIFAQGRKVLGWESGRLVIRDVQSWTLVSARVGATTGRFDNGTSTSDATWQAAHTDRDILLCLRRNGASAGDIELWDGTAQTHIDTLQHPGFVASMRLHDTGQLATATMAGEIKIWDLDARRCTATFTVPHFAYFASARHSYLAVGVGVANHEGDVHGKVVRTLGGEALPPDLTRILSRAEMTQGCSFADGSVVVGEIYGIAGTELLYEFSVIAADGITLGTFQDVSVKDVIVLMERYIVTASFCGDINIWSKQGALLVHQSTAYSNISLLQDGHGRLWAVSHCEGFFTDATAFDFGAPRTAAQLVSFAFDSQGTSKPQRNHDVSGL